MKRLLIQIFAIITITNAYSFAANAGSVKTSADAQTHVEIVDALIRFTNGMDTDNGDLIASAFTEQGVADFTPAAKKVGMQFPVLTGKQTIVSALVPFAANYTTSHSVTNTRAEVNGDVANLYALVEANHLPLNDNNSYYMMKNQYWMSLKKEDGVWRISQMTIENLWSQGQLSVMTGK
ncbi:MAG: hypothetical protein Alis3KO_10760 [Aliiglaciecola sp.]